jgi:HEPN domain-containing protein
MNKKVAYWLELAEYDLETARVMLAGGRFLYDGFMCHQVIEKVLKAYYASVKNELPPYTHNLRKLARDTGIYYSMDEDHRQLLTSLEPLRLGIRRTKMSFRAH